MNSRCSIPGFRLAAVFAILLFASGASAGEFLGGMPGETTEVFAAKLDRLVGIVNDRDAAVDELAFLMDAGGKVTEVLYSTHLNGRETGKKLFSLAQLATPDGAVLEEERGIKALSLHGTVDSKSGQADLIIRFVSNGMTGEYTKCAMKGVRTDGFWKLVNPRSLKPITQAKMLTWAFGIKTIEGICPAD